MDGDTAVTQRRRITPRQSTLHTRTELAHGGMVMTLVGITMVAIPITPLTVVFTMLGWIALLVGFVMSLIGYFKVRQWDADARVRALVGVILLPFGMVDDHLVTRHVTHHHARRDEHRCEDFRAEPMTPSACRTRRRWTRSGCRTARRPHFSDMPDDRSRSCASRWVMPRTYSPILFSDRFSCGIKLSPTRNSRIPC